MALKTPFAQNGDKKTIPQSTSDGSVSFDRGFGSFYALPPEEGGLFIDRAQFNQLMFDTTSQVLDNKQQIATQANRINEVNTTLTQSINTKANQATTYNKTEVNNLLNTKIDSTKATKILTENLVKTVGASGADFANLRQALEWASQYSYSGDRFTITLNCNADMPIPGVYLPIGEALIVINGQNNTFNCNSDYFFTASMNTSEQNGGIFNSNITIKNFILNYNDITTNAYGCAFQLTGINATFNNITININNSSINHNLIVFQYSNCYITNLKINCSGNTNINSNVILVGSSTVVCTTPRLNLSITGQITALFLFSNSKALINSTSSISVPVDKIQAQIGVYDGSIVSCNNEYNDTKLSQAPNTLTQNGIIFKR